jgi:acetylornithine/succinyldiaminopimelate/putrescine aminotransferase
VRSAGLLMGVELADFDTLWQVIQYCIQKGVLTDWFLFNNKTLRIAPPLTISEEEIIFACHVIIRALNE